MMLGFEPNWYWRITWLVVTPVAILVSRLSFHSLSSARAIVKGTNAMSGCVLGSFKSGQWTLQMMFVMSGYVQSSYKSDTVDFGDDVRDVCLCRGQLYIRHGGLCR